MEQDTNYMNMRHIKNNTTAPSEHDLEISYAELNLLPASGTSKPHTTGEQEPSYAQVNFTPQSPQQNQVPEVTPDKDEIGKETAGGRRSKKSRCLIVVGIIVIICNFVIITGLTVHVLQMNKEHVEDDPLNRTLAIALRNLTELNGKFQKLSETAQSLCPMLRSCSAESLCPSGWEDHNHHCYRFSTDTVNWDSAKQQCESLNSHLIIINTEQEQKSIENYPGDYWIGLTDRGSEGNWTWVDGTPVSFTQWYGGEPNNWNDHENCAFIRRTDWNDVSCTDQFRFICEKRALPCVEPADIEKYCS
ncbi:C-type lectin domain family 17, member A-like isoform X1 [Carcharodon carcharias]|uniref:C-type lectin domain family 17, member A-like isoform X1 n=1 Tax=Carcharodon carcharias TaxID=13397 RepID=UPI001B7F5E19|nr:C-type lectin domain family 17, member A-like isoform X1 [Carcharodon carcharias]